MLSVVAIHSAAAIHWELPKLFRAAMLKSRLAPPPAAALRCVGASARRTSRRTTARQAGSPCPLRHMCACRGSRERLFAQNVAEKIAILACRRKNGLEITLLASIPRGALRARFRSDLGRPCSRALWRPPRKVSRCLHGRQRSPSRGGRAVDVAPASPHGIVQHVELCSTRQIGGLRRRRGWPCSARGAVA